MKKYIFLAALVALVGCNVVNQEPQEETALTVRELIQRGYVTPQPPPSSGASSSSKVIEYSFCMTGCY